MKRRTFLALGVLLLAPALGPESCVRRARAGEGIRKGGIAGYLLAQNENVPETY